MTTTTYLPRIHYFQGPDECWAAPMDARLWRIHKAFVEHLCRQRCRVILHSDISGVAACDEVLRLVKPEWVEFGDGQYGVWVSRLRPVSESMAAGNDCGRAARLNDNATWAQPGPLPPSTGAGETAGFSSKLPAANPTSPAPFFSWSWFLRLMGVRA